MRSEYEGLTNDALHLLYAIELYTGGPTRPWLKDLSIKIMVHLGVTAGVFKHYDLAPSMTDFRGTKMFARISQEAIEDVDLLFRLDLVEQLVINTRYYAPTAAVRITGKGKDLLDDSARTAGVDRERIESLFRCPTCRQPLDFVVGRELEPEVRLIVSKVCSCTSGGRHRTADFWHSGEEVLGQSVIEGFFCIGTIAYKGKSHFLGERHAK